MRPYDDFRLVHNTVMEAVAMHKLTEPELWSTIKDLVGAIVKTVDMNVPNKILKVNESSSQTEIGAELQTLFRGQETLLEHLRICVESLRSYA